MTTPAIRRLIPLVILIIGATAPAHGLADELTDGLAYQGTAPEADQGADQWADQPAGTPASTSAADVAANDHRRLFHPTPTERAAEARGRIYIYDGLRDVDVQRALDEEFDRVESMMFIRTRKTEPDGELRRDPKTGEVEVEVEDDGC
ncbi:hypothetical protein [Thiocapsa rosea]|uniref:Uncharacterized protein n=1 Tax=Thiocapsa rosea TaxID=69360 RepID=A0A495VDZ0_9GAMM|nr:hypothetical protein [Thiocapsa rosea]RKT47611.1 hypothetical protein BDD21_5208 [Thiocapsa rosea]